MYKEFSYIKDSTLIEIMNGVFYDKDLDESLTNLTIVDYLSLTTTANDNWTGLDFDIWAYDNSTDLLFHVSQPINGITSNDESKKLKFSYQDLTGDEHHFLSNVGTSEGGDPCTYEEKEFRIRAKDSQNQESAPLTLIARAINTLPTFKVKYLDLAGNVINNTNIASTGDGFKIHIYDVADIEDGANYLSSLDFSDIDNLSKYVKIKRTNVENETRTNYLDIPGFNLNVEYDHTGNELMLIYTCYDLILAGNEGSQILKVLLYDSMGVNEQRTVTEVENQVNRTASSETFILNIEGVTIDIVPIANPITIGADTFSSLPLTSSTFDENSSYIKIPFTVKTNTPVHFSFAINIREEDVGFNTYGVDTPCKIKPVDGGSQEVEINTITIEDSNIKWVYFNGTYTDEIYGGIIITKKHGWWGNLEITIRVGAGENGILGSSAATWILDIGGINNAPELLV